MNQLQKIVVDSIRKELDHKLFQNKINFASKTELSEYEKGYLKAVDDMEDQIEEVIRYFERKDFMMYFGGKK